MRRESEDEVDDASKLAQSLAVWAGLVRQRHGRRCSSHISPLFRGLGLWGLLGPFLGGEGRSCSREKVGREALLREKGFGENPTQLELCWEEKRVG